MTRRAPPGPSSSTCRVVWVDRVCLASVGDAADPLPSAGSMEDTWREAEKGRDSHDAVRPRVRGVAQVASLGVHGVH